MPDQGEAVEKVSLAAAMAQSYERDQFGFATLVALLLEGSLPSAVEVERRPVRLFSSEKRVHAVKVSLGDEVFDLTDPGGNKPLIARKVKIVRGITLKTEQINIDKWLQDLDAALSVYAKNNQSTSEAIADFLRERGM